MSVLAPFAYSADGEFYVCGDGPELYCYGSDDKPRWKQFLDGILAGVGASYGTVHALDDQGGYTLWDPITGQSRGKVDLGASCHRLEVTENGVAVVLTDRGAMIVGKDGQARPLSAPPATAAAFSMDGQRVALGTASGDLLLFDVATGSQIAGTQLGAAIADISRCGSSEWVVAAGKQLVFVAASVQLQPAQEGMPAPSPIRKQVPIEGTPTRVAANPDGVLVACDDGGQTVLVYETHQYRLGGTVVYQRELGDLMFGPATSLGIGLEYADANRVEVLSGATARSLPGLGKGSTPWFPRVKFDQYILRGAVATKRAGGMPIANVRQVESQSSGRTMLFVAIGIGSLLACCGISGTLFTIWRFVLN